VYSDVRMYESAAASDCAKLNARRYGSMTRYFGCDARKHYPIFTSVDETGSPGPYIIVENERSIFRGCLEKIPAGCMIIANKS
jgi:hypothetical protein